MNLSRNKSKAAEKWKKPDNNKNNRSSNKVSSNNANSIRINSKLIITDLIDPKMIRLKRFQKNNNKTILNSKRK